MVDLDTNLKEKTLEFNFFNQTIIQKKFKKRKIDEVESVGKKIEKPKEKKEKKKKKSKFNLGNLWKERELVERVAKIALRFLWDILRVIRWDRLYLEVDIATPDPAFTGVLYGKLCSVKYSTEYFFPKAHIRVQPDFVNQFPKGSAETDFSIRPLNLVTSISKMFFALPKIRLVKTFILKKRR